MLTRDEEFDFRAAHWTDLHCLLREELPPSVVLYGHVFLSFSLSDDKTEVKIKTKVLKTNGTIEIKGNLLIAADGCLSSIRQSFLPDLKLRFFLKPINLDPHAIVCRNRLACELVV